MGIRIGQVAAPRLPTRGLGWKGLPQAEEQMETRERSVYILAPGSGLASGPGSYLPLSRAPHQ